MMGWAVAAARPTARAGGQQAGRGRPSPHMRPVFAEQQGNARARLTPRRSCPLVNIKAPDVGFRSGRNHGPHGRQEIAREGATAGS